MSSGQLDNSRALLEELRERGKLQDASHPEELSSLLKKQPITFYCGFDPTAESLHVGSLLPLITIKRFIARGHSAVILLGSATGMIGDPSGKSSERSLLPEETLKKNVAALRTQIKSIVADTSGNSQITFVENGSWLGNLSYIEILRDIGKDFSVNYMMSKDSVKSRLTERDQGISYTEFSYMLLQAYDFYHLYKKHSCRLQIGGSDQWGNITAGLDYIRKKGEGSGQAFALTFPLVTNSDGKKFGKSEAGNVWLSKELSSPYAFYQFWLNTADEDIEKYLLYFSLRSLEEISSLTTEHKKAPEKRLAQIALAEELTTLLHGKDELEKVKKATTALFSQAPETLDGASLLALSGEIPTCKLSTHYSSFPNEGIPIQELLVLSEAAQSKSAGRKLIENGGVYVNHVKITDVNNKISSNDFIDKKALLLRTGKKNYFLIEHT